jgi:hypothetical protein
MKSNNHLNELLVRKKQQNLKFDGGVKHDNIAKLEDCEHSTKLTMNINQNLSWPRIFWDTFGNIMA